MLNSSDDPEEPRDETEPKQKKKNIQNGQKYQHTDNVQSRPGNTIDYLIELVTGNW